MNAGVARSRSSAGLLAVAALYLAAEWTGAAKLGGGHIFPASRRADQAAFRQMTAALSGAAERACGSGVRRLLFPDGDVTLGYLPLDRDRIGGCEAIHETGVTPFTDADMARCDAALVEAYAPPLPPVAEIASGADAELTTAGWLPLEHWASGDGRFGFAIYRRRCAAGRP